MKTLLKVLSGLVLVLALIVAGVVIFRDAIVKTALEQGVPRATGFPFRLAALDTRIFPGQVHIQMMEMNNPPDFTDPVFFSIPEIFVDCDWMAYVTGKRVEIPEMRLHLKSIHIVRRADGVLNIDRLGGEKEESPGEPTAQPGEQPTPPRKPRPPAEEDPIPIHIGRMEITLGEIVYKNYQDRPANDPREMKYDFGVKKMVLTDQRDPQEIVKAILKEAFLQSPLKNVENLAGAVVDDVKNSLQESLKKMREEPGSLLENSGEKVKEAGEKVSGKAGGLIQGLGGLLQGGEKKEGGGTSGDK